MSGIAEVLSNLGYKVSGSDLNDSEAVRRLKASGIRVFKGHAAAHARGAQVLVTSSAVPASNPEIVFARKSGIPVVARAEMLAEIGRMKKTITIAGSHGKTTTTSMAAMALWGAGADPTVIIGGQLKNINSNARLGVGEYLVAEADESDGSFIHLNPLVAVVTNIDDDHLDFHKSLSRLKRAFLSHLERLPFYGAAVLCSDDKGLSEIIGQVRRPTITYGFGPKAEWRLTNVRLGPQGSRFDVVHRGRRVASGRLGVPGRHNVLNALGAIAAGHFLGFSVAGMLKGLAQYQGVGRRLDLLGTTGGIRFIDDYGHHPTEIAATLSALKLGKPERLIAIFQPHRYSRTKRLWREFGRAFKGATQVYLMDIYAAGEKPIPGVSSKLILESLRKRGIAVTPFRSSLEIARQLRPGDLVVTLGAGDVWRIGEDLLRRTRSHFARSV